jgi:hypothetical protein
LEYWSDGVLAYGSERVLKKDNNPLVITPTLQYSKTPKLPGIESSHDGLLFWSYRSEILSPKT